MKKTKIITLIIMPHFWPEWSFSMVDSLSFYSQCRLLLMYSNLDHRLEFNKKKVETAMMEHTMFMEFIDRRFQRVEDKFDKYFLWGYGTMLIIFVGVLIWILNRMNVPSAKEMHPPTSDHHDGKQKYLFPVKGN